MAPRELLGPLELEVLRFICRHQPVTVRVVADHFAQVSGHARTTVLTVMDRLRKKKYLTRRKEKGGHHYTSTVEQNDLLQGMVDDFVTNVLGGSVSPFVAYLAKSPKLDDAQVKRIEKLLEQLRADEEAENDGRSS